MIGAPFILLRRVHGLVPTDPAARAELSSADESRSITRSMVSVLARLHMLDWAALGLERRAGGYLDRQVRRWSSQLELTATAPRLGPALTEITEWIHANVPESPPDAIVHGDYSLNNVIVSHPPRAEIAAVVDWEMATIGDPFTDLAWMLRGWVQAPAGGVENPGSSLTRQEGAVTVDEAVELYEQETGRTFTNRRFYEAFCAWKGIAILEGLYASYVGGTAADPSVARFESTNPASVEALHKSLG